LENYISKVFSVWILFLVLSHVICLCKSLLLTSFLPCVCYIGMALFYYSHTY